MSVVETDIRLGVTPGRLHRVDGLPDLASHEPFTPKELTTIVAGARNIIIEAMKPEGMIAAQGERWGTHRFARDLFEVAEDVFEINQLQPDSELVEKTHDSLLGFFETFQTVNGIPPHEVAPINSKDPLFVSGFFEPQGNWMVNKQSVDALVKGFDIMPKYLTDAETKKFIPRVFLGLNWLLINMNGSFLSYSYSQNGGLVHPIWMDSALSVQHTDPTLNTVERSLHGETIYLPKDPIQPLETVPPAARALYRWGNLLKDIDPTISKAALDKAHSLKDKFMSKFRLEDEIGPYFAHAIDGDGNPVEVFSINNAEVLAYPFNGGFLVPFEDAVAVGRRLMSPLMFNPDFGIRTFEEGHSIQGDNYHLGENGFTAVYWPRGTNRVARGVRNVAREAKKQGRIEIIQEFRDYERQLHEANIRFYRQFGFSEQRAVGEDGIAKPYGKGTPSESQRRQVWSASAMAKSALNLLAT